MAGWSVRAWFSGLDSSFQGWMCSEEFGISTGV